MLSCGILTIIIRRRRRLRRWWRKRRRRRRRRRRRWWWRRRKRRPLFQEVTQLTGQCSIKASNKIKQSHTVRVNSRSLTLYFVNPKTILTPADAFLGTYCYFMYTGEEPISNTELSYRSLQSLSIYSTCQGTSLRWRLHVYHKYTWEMLTCICLIYNASNNIARWNATLLSFDLLPT